MRIELEEAERDVDRKKIFVHQPSDVILKYVELCQYAGWGSWDWLTETRRKNGLLTLTISNYNAASVIYRELKRAAEMTMRQAQEAAGRHYTLYLIWKEMTLLLIEQP